MPPCHCRTPFSKIAPCALILGCVVAGCAGTSENESSAFPTPPPPPPNPAVEPAPMPEPYLQADAGASAAAAPAAPPNNPAPPSAPVPEPQSYATAYPTGQWIYTADNEWIWVPNGAGSVDFEGIPYVYLYTPSIGWNWYVSPWGPGPYVYGPWIHHPWHPVGWHGYWVAHPRVRMGLGRGRLR
jgi:hypothetical protein